MQICKYTNKRKLGIRNRLFHCFIDSLIGNSRQRRAGFTLIELLVVVGILVVLFGGTLLALNPFAQFEKARDAKRQEDLQTIKTALDSYYNDNGCYPTTLTFDAPWTAGATTYLKQVPQDEECRSGHSICYSYQTDNSSCPQWNVLYAKMYTLPSGTTKCTLSSLNPCTPSNFASSGYNYCTVSGNPDCYYLSNSSLVVSSYVTLTPVPPTRTPTPAPPTPTFTPYPTQACAPKAFKCIGSSCNNVGGNNGDFCGFQGCQGNACCSNSCH